MSKDFESILFLTLEFSQWQRARSWSYATQLGFEEGFGKCGYHVTTVPVLHELAPNDPGSWLFYLEDLCRGKHFDQVWVELIHSSLDDSVLSFLKEVAPIRVGFLCESLDYSPEAYSQFPQLKGRRALVEQRLRAMTHVLAGDEKDAEDFNRRGLIPSLWFPSAIPERYIEATAGCPTIKAACFSGSPYGRRELFIRDPQLQGLLITPDSPEEKAGYPARFDALHTSLIQLLRKNRSFDGEIHAAYLDTLRALRRRSFRLWQESLRNYVASVNLPHLLNTYAGRVLESMAAGVPVISWEVPNRPRTRDLFTEGRDILLFPADGPQTLASHITSLIADPELARSLSMHGLIQAERFHTLELRVQQVMTWIQSGIEPQLSGNASADSVDLLEKKFYSRISSAPRPTDSGIGPTQTIETPPPEAGEVQRDRFYSDLFLKRSGWQTLEPNNDEKARWAKISRMLESVVEPGSHPRILDVGCGRGWLTNLLSTLGEAEGVEPVEAVLKSAMQMLPHLRFTLGSVNEVSGRSDFVPYDLIVSSEVIEHVRYAEQQSFVGGLRKLLSPKGHAIITSPRKEVFERWMEYVNNHRQPVDDWLTEQELKALFEKAGFLAVARDRVHYSFSTATYVELPSPADIFSGQVIPLYQIWLFKAV